MHTPSQSLEFLRIQMITKFICLDRPSIKYYEFDDVQDSKR